MFTNTRYEIKDIAGTGAIAAVNDSGIMKRFNDLGMPCRPTAKQHTISISVQEDTQKRLRNAAKVKGRSVSNILEEIAIKWLNENKL
ncbi:MAG: ribbon-helix-helix protein, CopG family [Ruminococcus sp.]|nr:ribbon-helix-helix protein, CopG family [Ruminococcus sp.]